MSNTARRAVFLDRDGVLNVYLPGDYAKTPDDLILLPGAAQAVRRLNDAGLPVFVLSNQQGVGKGIMSHDDLRVVDTSLRDKLQREAGATVLQSYYCTHLSADQCECRKPGPGLFLQAAREHNLDLSASVFVGDTETDAQAARAANVGTFIFVLSGKYQNNPAVLQNPDRFPQAPNHTAPDLAQAVEWLLCAE